jgi:hypothetical protein
VTAKVDVIAATGGYAPAKAAKEATKALTGKWNPPPVTRVSLPAIGGQ